MEGDVSIYVPSIPGERLHQGEILSGVIQARVKIESLAPGSSPILDCWVHPFVIVASQNCDLEQDFTVRSTGEGPQYRLVPNVLLCEMTDESSIRKDQDLKSKQWDQIKLNKNERYHYLRSVPKTKDSLGSGLPVLAIDFKRFFTIPTDELYRRLASEIKRRCRLITPYCEHFASRFYYYQSRIALPEEHYLKPSQADSAKR